jgi:hypothetical protein
MTIARLKSEPGPETDHVTPEQPEPEQANACVAVGYNVADEGETATANADVSPTRDRNSVFVNDMYQPFGKARLSCGLGPS